MAKEAVEEVEEMSIGGMVVRSYDSQGNLGWERRVKKKEKEKRKKRKKREMKEGEKERKRRKKEKGRKKVKKMWWK